MSAPHAAALLASLRNAIAFEAIGEPIGNLVIGRGMLRARALHVALV